MVIKVGSSSGQQQQQLKGESDIEHIVENSDLHHIVELIKNLDADSIQTAVDNTDGYWQ